MYGWEREKGRRDGRKGDRGASHAEGGEEGAKVGHTRYPHACEDSGYRGSAVRMLCFLARIKPTSGMEQNRKVDQGSEKNDDKRAVDRKEPPPPLTETRARCQGGAVDIPTSQVLEKNFPGRQGQASQA